LRCDQTKMCIFLPHGYEKFSKCLYDVFEEYLESVKLIIGENEDI